jgi:UDP-glucose 4-epimerase
VGHGCPLEQKIEFSVKILIVGGFGFIGGQLGAYLNHKNYDVTLGSRKLTPSLEYSSKANAIRLDLNNKSDLKHKLANFDVVIHAAGMNAKNCLKDPDLALQINGYATSNLVNAALKSHVKLFIYISTAHVYSDPLIGNFDERSNLLNTHPYATSHIYGENSVLNAGKKDSLKTIVLRISNVIGCPINRTASGWDLLISDLCKQSVIDKKMIITSSKNEIRNFLTMTDLSRVIESIIRLQGVITYPDLINLGGKSSHSILDMALMIQKRCSSKLNFAPKIEIANKKLENSLDQLDYNSIHKYLFEKYLLDNKANEIDQLLHFCNLWFSCKKKLQ